ncbi:amino acid adenylation domain-containing protein [Actinoplanes sp. NPDC049265]|uniref:amino acid adenylation domain-containing protein n=1 Tax=Actinoplanes sp. NPDC049265 TaxID=3363902 RepID=UPI003717F2A0
MDIVAIDADQERMLFLHQLEARLAPAHSAVAMVRFAGPVVLEALSAAVKELTRGRSWLGAAFAPAENRFVRTARAGGPLAVTVIDVEAGRGDATAILDAAITLTAEPFEPGRAPLVRCALVRPAGGPGPSFVIVMAHRCVLDQPSVERLLSDVLVRYAAAGGPDAPEPAITAWPEPAEDPGSLAFWRERLNGLTPLQLPADLRPPPSRSYAARTSTLRGIPATGRLAPESALAAAFVVLLARYSSGDDIAVGVAARPPGRQRGAPGHPMGPLETLHIVRVDTGKTVSFGELVRQVERERLTADRHHVPLGRLIRAIAPSADPTRAPLVQATFAYRDRIPDGSCRAAGVEHVPVAPPVTERDLDLTLRRSEDGYEASLTYNAEMFTEATATRMLRQFAVIVGAGAAAPGLSLGAIPMSDPEELAELARFGSGPVFPPISGDRVDELVAEQARIRPHAIAVEQGELRLSYHELDQAGDRVATALQRAGVCAGDAVGVIAHRSADMVAGLLGVLRAGAAYVPIDPGLPALRVRYQVLDSGLRALLTSDDVAIPDGLGPVVVDLAAAASGADLDDDGARPAEHDQGPAGLMYICYTSGSTGRPKGVMVEHRSVTRLILRPGFVDMGPDEVVLHAGSLAFDVSQFEIWAPLVNGARLVLAPRPPWSAVELGRFVRQTGITTMWLSAGLFHEFVDSAPEFLGSVRQLIAGGDILSPEHCARVLATCPGLTLINGYGPTEGTIFATSHRITADDLSSSVPIGRPLPHTEVRILGHGDAPAPVGVPGEIHLGGPGVARGYRRSPETTAARFFTAADGRRLYRTGDLGRWLPDGTLQFFGRADDQVKIRGFRIELGEIESQLVQHGGVLQCAVVAHPPASLEKQLIAYVVPADPGLTGAALRGLLAGLLPGYMVPRVVLVDSLPLNASGKVDRSALAERPTATTGEQNAPGSPVQAQLALLWAEVLRRDPGTIGPTADFFELGGDSLLGGRLVALISRFFGSSLPLRALFDAPTLAGLEAELQARRGRGAGDRPSPRRYPRPERPPLSFAQRRLWFLDQLRPDSNAYNLAIPVRIRGPLDRARLAEAANAVIGRHESLRTHYGSADGEPYQIIAPVLRLDLPHDTLEHDGSVQGWIRRLSAAPFDLARGPLVRPALLTVSETEHVFLLTAHHSVVDAWSAALFHEEVADRYAHGGPPPPPDAIQFADIGMWQRAHLADEAVARDLRAYPRRRLAGAPPVLALPADGPRPAVQTYSGATEWFTIPAERAKRLRESGRDHGTTLFMTLLGAFALLLSRQSGQDDLVIGSPAANRAQPETRNVIGLLVDTIAIRMDLSGDPTVAQLMRRTRESVLDAFTYQDLPFEVVVEELRPARDLAYHPLFQVLFNLVPAEADAREAGGLSWEPMVAEEMAAKFDLSLYVWDGPEELRCALIYNADLYSPERMAAFTVQYLDILTGLAGRPDARAGAIETGHVPALPDPVLARVPATAPRLLDRFDDIARRHPRRRAIVSDTGEWTYGELDERATELAGGVAATAGPGSVIAVVAARHPQLVAALLATTLAGSTFALIDGNQPARRLARQILAAGSAGRIDIVGGGVAPQVRPVDGAAETGHTGAGPGHIVFTSGSGGEPRGVLSSLAPLERFLSWQADRFGLTHRDRFGLLSGPGHDPVLRDVFAALYSGGEIHIPAPGVHREPRRLAAWLGDHRITICHLTPSLLDAMGADRPPPVPSLRYLFLGGEPLTSDHLATARRLAPCATLVNFYGATETPQAVAYHVVPEDDLAALPVPVGTGVADAQILVCRDRRHLCGVGEIGEIGVRSPHLARGYVGSPARSDGFAVNPFSGDPADRIYWTGDLGRFLPDGSVRLAGRRDRQINLRGFRVEPAEIEAVLRRHPDVWEAAVVAVDAGAGPVLCAFVVPQPGVALSPALAEQVRAELPDHLVPGRIVPLDTLPRLSGGKVDHRALESTRLVAPAREPAGLGGMDEVEDAIVRIWRELTGGPPADLDTSFFETGTSLLAVRLVAQLRRRFAIDLPLHQLFENPSVRRLAVTVRGRTGRIDG